MKELVCCDAGDRLRVLLYALRGGVDGGRESVLHAAARGTATEVVQEQVVVERTVAHPLNFGRRQLAGLGSDGFQVVVGGVSVYQNFVVRSAFVERLQSKIAEFDW